MGDTRAEDAYLDKELRMHARAESTHVCAESKKAHAPPKLRDGGEAFDDLEVARVRISRCT
eukprot:6093555-Pleurochrysis_carterae.AAC.1